jgi:reactive intermediate/imine deaminase
VNKTAINTQNAPAAIGTYSQAIQVGNFVFVSGQIPLNPETGELIEGDISQQIDQVFKNLKAVAEAAGASLQNAVKITVYLTDLSHFATVNEIMNGYFEQPYPARAALGVTSGGEVRPVADRDPRVTASHG